MARVVTWSLVHELANAKVVQVKMMRDRGFAVPLDEAALLDAPRDRVAAAFMAHARERGCSLAEALSRDYEPAAGEPPQGAAPPRTAVVFLDNAFNDAKGTVKMTSTDDLRAALAQVAARGVRAAIVVVPNRLSPLAKIATGEGGDALRVQVVQLAQLALCVTEHELVADHRALSSDAAAAALRAAGIAFHQLPTLRDTDPVAVHYGYAPGAVVRVTRRDGTVELCGVANALPDGKAR